MKPTDEQIAARDAFKAGGVLAIEAGAGTGKTTTLKLLAESTRRRGQYVAFNSAIVKETDGKMPDTVRANTAHSLAYKAIGWKYRKRMDASRRIRTEDIAAYLGLQPIWVDFEGGKGKKLRPRTLAGIVLKGVEHFCQSADPEPTQWHFPYIDGIDSPKEDGSRTYNNNNAIRAQLTPALRQAWHDLQRVEGGTLPFKHDHYLKLWQLGNPKLMVDYILFDEAQDANPVIQAVIQAQDQAQRVWVGDSQQQIYEFTGAVNALAKVEADHRTYLSQSFRFGPAVAEVANELLARLDSPLKLRGNPLLASKVGYTAHPDCILTRGNATAVRCVIAQMAAGRKAYVLGGGTEVVSFARASERLMRGQSVDHRDLSCFDTWLEVQEYVENDPQGSDLSLLVKLIDDYGPETVIEVLGNANGYTEKTADVLISTAHKAKGREWDSVQLADDFPPGETGDGTAPAELRLLYVAATRAKLQLDITKVGLLTPAAPVESPSVALGA